MSSKKCVCCNLLIKLVHRIVNFFVKWRNPQTDQDVVFMYSVMNDVAESYRFFYHLWLLVNCHEQVLVIVCTIPVISVRYRSLISSDVDIKPIAKHNYYFPKVSYLAYLSGQFESSGSFSGHTNEHLVHVSCALRTIPITKIPQWYITCNFYSSLIKIIFLVKYSRIRICGLQSITTENDLTL